MDIALCLADGKNYSAKSFEDLGDHIISSYRRQLVCPECRGPAFYRKESKSGQAACFGARPHGKDCDLAAAEAKQGGGLGPDKEERINYGERIEVDFNFGAHAVEHANPEEPEDPNGRGGRYARGHGVRSRSSMHRRLSTLLKNLIHSQDFRDSDQIIALPEGEFRVKNFFVEFSKVSEIHLDEFRGYWGMVSDAGISSGSLWLNSGGREAVSVVVNGDLSDGFIKRFPCTDTDDFAGAYILVFGVLKVSKNAKRYVVINQLEKISVNFAD